MEEYNWNLILKVAIPIGLIEAFVFYKDMPKLWQYFLLAIGLAIALWIIYSKEKSKRTIFTALGVILLCVLAVKLLRELGMV